MGLAVLSGFESLRFHGAILYNYPAIELILKPAGPRQLKS